MWRQRHSFRRGLMQEPTLEQAPCAAGFAPVQHNQRVAPKKKEPASNSPVFRCRKTLTFNDSDLLSDDDGETETLFKGPLLTADRGGRVVKVDAIQTKSNTVVVSEPALGRLNGDAIAPTGVHQAGGGNIRPAGGLQLSRAGSFKNRTQAGNGPPSSDRTKDVVKKSVSVADVVQPNKPLFRRISAEGPVFLEKKLTPKELGDKKSPAPSARFTFEYLQSEPEHAYFPRRASPPPAQPPHINKVFHSERTAAEASPGGPRAAGDAQGAGGIERNITVCVRKRPLLTSETKRKEIDMITVDAPETVTVNVVKVSLNLEKYIHQHVFQFDKVFNEHKSNTEVYMNTVKPLIDFVFQRGHAMCFAFGQTGAGKSYTLLGSTKVPGLYQLAAHDIFEELKKRKQMQLWISYYEIYNNQLYDLLNRRARLQVRENSHQKVCVAGLMETQVSNIGSLVQAIKFGNGVRRTGSTGVNDVSSRSHAVLQLELRDAQNAKVGRLTFIDLAGSERAADVTDSNKQTRVEGAGINQSLLALKECIRSMGMEKNHTPFRQSKLTHILRDSFLGKSHTVMIANVAPSQSACENTLNALRYADRVRNLPNSSNISDQNVSSARKEDNHVSSARKEDQNVSSARREEPVERPITKKVTPTGTLFHPSNIQYSSTPIKTGAGARGTGSPGASPVVRDFPSELPSSIMTHRSLLASVLDPSPPGQQATVAPERREGTRAEAGTWERQVTQGLHVTSPRTQPHTQQGAGEPSRGEKHSYSSEEGSESFNADSRKSPGAVSDSGCSDLTKTSHTTEASNNSDLSTTNSSVISALSADSQGHAAAPTSGSGTALASSTVLHSAADLTAVAASDIGTRGSRGHSREETISQARVQPDTTSHVQIQQEINAHVQRQREMISAVQTQQEMISRAQSQQDSDHRSHQVQLGISPQETNNMQLHEQYKPTPAHPHSQQAQAGHGDGQAPTRRDVRSNHELHDEPSHPPRGSIPHPNHQETTNYHRDVERQEEEKHPHVQVHYQSKSGTNPQEGANIYHHSQYVTAAQHHNQPGGALHAPLHGGHHGDNLHSHSQPVPYFQDVRQTKAKSKDTSQAGNVVLPPDMKSRTVLQIINNEHGQYEEKQEELLQQKLLQSLVAQAASERVAHSQLRGPHTDSVVGNTVRPAPTPQQTYRQEQSGAEKSEEIHRISQKPREHDVQNVHVPFHDAQVHKDQQQVTQFPNHSRPDNHNDNNRRISTESDEDVGRLSSEQLGKVVYMDRANMEQGDVLPGQVAPLAQLRYSVERHVDNRQPLGRPVTTEQRQPVERHVAAEQRHSLERLATTGEMRHSLERLATTGEMRHSLERLATTGEKRHSLERLATTGEKRHSLERLTTKEEKRHSLERILPTEEKRHSLERILPTEEKRHSLERLATTEEIHSFERPVTAEEKRYSLERLATTEEKRHSLERLATTEEKRYSLEGLASSEQRHSIERPVTAEEKRHSLERIFPTDEKRHSLERLATTEEKIHSSDRLATTDTRQSLQRLPASEHRQYLKNTTTEHNQYFERRAPEENRGFMAQQKARNDEQRLPAGEPGHLHVVQLREDVTNDPRETFHEKHVQAVDKEGDAQTIYVQSDNNADISGTLPTPQAFLKCLSDSKLAREMVSKQLNHGRPGEGARGHPGVIPETIPLHMRLFGELLDSPSNVKPGQVTMPGEVNNTQPVTMRARKTLQFGPAESKTTNTGQSIHYNTNGGRISDASTESRGNGPTSQPATSVQHGGPQPPDTLTATRSWSDILSNSVEQTQEAVPVHREEPRERGHEGRHGGPPEGRHGGQPEGRHGGQPEGRHGGQPEGRHGGPPEGRHGGPPEGRHGGPPEGTHGGPPEGRQDGAPEGRQGGAPEGRQAMLSGPGRGAFEPVSRAPAGAGKKPLVTGVGKKPVVTKDVAGAAGFTRAIPSNAARTADHEAPRARHQNAAHMTKEKIPSVSFLPIQSFPVTHSHGAVPICEPNPVSKDKPGKPQAHPHPGKPQAVHPHPGKPQAVHPHPSKPQTVHPHPSKPQTVHPHPRKTHAVPPKHSATTGDKPGNRQTAAPRIIKGPAGHKTNISTNGPASVAAAQPRSPRAAYTQTVVSAHEQQLTGITYLCKQEMDILMAVQGGKQEFGNYIAALKKILTRKASLIADLEKVLTSHSD